MATACPRLGLEDVLGAYELMVGRDLLSRAWLEKRIRRMRDADTECRRRGYCTLAVERTIHTHTVELCEINQRISRAETRIAALRSEIALLPAAAPPSVD